MRLSALLLALWLVSPGAAWAAPPEAPLSLQAAIAAAARQALDVETEQYRLNASQADRDVAAAASLPELSLRNNLNYTQLPGGSSAAGLGGLVGFPQAGGTLDTTLAGNVTLFDAFTDRDNLVIAEDQVRLARLTLEHTRQNAMRDAAVAYFDVLDAEAQTETATLALSQSQSHLRIGEARLKEGTATLAEVLKLRAELASGRRNLIQARHAVTRARLTLESTMNAEVGDRPLEPDPAVRPLDAEPVRDVPGGVARRQDVVQSEVRARQDQVRADLQGRAHWPTLSGNSQYTQRGFGAGQFMAGVGLNWTLFDGQQSRLRAEAARFQAQASLAQLARSRQQAALDIRQQHDLREAAREIQLAAADALRSADEAYRIAGLRYAEGLSSTLEVVDAQATLADARRAYQDGVRDLRVAEVQLARALGLDLATYLGGGPVTPSPVRKDTPRG